MTQEKLAELNKVLKTVILEKPVSKDTLQTDSDIEIIIEQHGNEFLVFRFWDDISVVCLEDYPNGDKFHIPRLFNELLEERYFETFEELKDYVMFHPHNFLVLDLVRDKFIPYFD